MINHRRWPALLLCAAMTLSSVSVLAMAGENQSTTEMSIASLSEIAQPPEENETEVTELAEAEYELDSDTEQFVPEQTPEDEDTIKIMLNGEPVELSVKPVIIGGNTYVSLRAFTEIMGCQVNWSPSGMTTVTCGSELKLEVQAGSDLICANDRYFYMPDKAVTIDGTLMVPIRGLAKVFTLSVEWRRETNTVFLTGGQVLASAEVFYNSDDLLWLSRIIHAESRGEPLEGKIAVGNVVINRTKAQQFPNTIYDVIFDKKHGTQFTPTKNGTIFNTPSEESVLAAKLCLEGHEEAGDALYFLSKASPNSWIVRNRTIVAKIGNHTFYS